jgi:hypothetical protein
LHGTPPLDERGASFVWYPDSCKVSSETLRSREGRDANLFCSPYDAVDVIVDFFARVPSRRTVIVLEHNGDSAWDRVPDYATAFGHRAWPYNCVVTSAWSDPKDAEANIAWTREFFNSMRPFVAPGAYVNYLGGDEGADGLKAAYGAKLARLAALKTKFDPTNLFRMNLNIAPASAATSPISK